VGGMNVSELVEKYLKEKAEEIKKETIERINDEAGRAVHRFEKLIEQLREQAKITLPAPLNVLDILSNGGYIYSKTFENEYDKIALDCIIYLGGREVLRFDWDARPSLKKGTYRATIIIEKLGE
jgi:hypothetical protein